MQWETEEAFEVFKLEQNSISYALKALGIALWRVDCMGQR